MKLNFELVPKTCWHSNLRKMLKQNRWNQISKDVRDKANHKCEICGEECDRLEAHEQWEYDDVKHIQRLKRIIAVCPPCHQVIHIGATQRRCGQEGYIAALHHYVNVNECDMVTFDKELAMAMTLYKKRSEYSDWTFDEASFEENGVLKKYFKGQ